MSKNAYILEAFKQFDSLMEEEELDVIEREEMPITGVDTEKMHDFLDTVGDDSDIDIIDLEAEAEDELKQSYIGSIILDCNVCHSNIFINKDEVSVSEDGVANLETECPYCMSNEGYTIIGEVQPYSEFEEEEVPEETDIESEPIDDIESEEGLEESMKLDGIKELRGRKKLHRRDDKDGVKAIRGRNNSEISGTDDLRESCENCDDVDDVDEGLITKDEYDDKMEMVGKDVANHKIGDNEFEYAQDVLKQELDEANGSSKKYVVITSGGLVDGALLNGRLFDSREEAAEACKKWKNSYSKKDKKILKPETSIHVYKPGGPFDKAVKANKKNRLKEYGDTEKLKENLDSSEFKRVEELLDDAGVEYNYVDEYCVDCCSDEDAERAYDILWDAGYDCNLESSDDEYRPDSVIFESHKVKYGKRNLKEAIKKNKGLVESSHARKSLVAIVNGVFEGTRFKNVKVTKEKGGIRVDFDKVEKPISEQTADTLAQKIELFDSRINVYPEVVGDTYIIFDITYLTESLKESIEDVTINTEDETMTMTTKDDGGVVVETSPNTEEIADDFIEEPVESEETFEPGDEIIGDISDDDVDEIELNSEVDALEDEDIDALDEPDEFDADEFDEESFDTLGESYLRRQYDNVEGFKTVNAKVFNNSLIVEGVIRFNSGASKGTSFVFEAAKMKNNKVMFEGYNTQISRGKKTFKLNCSLNEGCIKPQKMSYNYMAKNELNESVRVNGTVKVK